MMTDSLQERLAEALSLANDKGHSYLTVEHLLFSLLRDKQIILLLEK